MIDDAVGDLQKMLHDVDEANVTAVANEFLSDRLRRLRELSIFPQFPRNDRND